MAGKDQFEGRTRARVGRAGRSAPGLGMITALLGAGLLLLLVLAGSLDAPAAPAVAILPPTAVPSPAPPDALPAPPQIESRLYLATRAGAAASIEVLDARGAPVYSLPGRDFALSADYGTLFVLHADALSAHAAGDGAEIWRIPVAKALDSQPGQPSALVARPDGAAVGVISDLGFPDGSAGFLAMQQVNARSGALLGEMFLEGWNRRDALFFSANSQRVIVPGLDGGVQLRAAGSGVTQIVTRSLDPTIAVLPFPGAAQLAWVTAPLVDRSVSADHGVNVALLDTSSLRQAREFWVALPAAHWPTPLGAATNQRLALRLLEEPSDAADLTMTALTNKLAVIDLATSRIDRLLPLERQPTALAFDQQSDALYVAYAPAGGGAEIVRFDPAGYAAAPVGGLAAAEVVRMAVGPAAPALITRPAPFEVPPVFPTARPLDQPPFDRSTPLTTIPPMPLIEPLTRTTVITISAEIGHGGKRIFTAQGERIGRGGELAWLSVPTMAGFDVVSVDSGGAATVRARGVAAAIARPGAAPWLLIRQPGGWLLRDLAANRDQPLQIPAGRQLLGCVADPAGLRLACQSSPTTLAIIAVADGAVATIPNAGALRGGLPLGWTLDGIYGYSLTDAARTLWLVDAARAAPAPLPLLAGAEADRFALASGRIVYTDSAARELRIGVPAAGGHTILATGVDLAGGMFSLAPDGRRVAYARPGAAGAYDLIVADLDAGEQAVAATGLAFVAYSWRWSPAGDRLAYRVLEPPGSPQRERIAVIDAASGGALADLALPGHTVAGVEFAPGGMLATLIYEGMQADLLLLAPDGRRQRLGMAYPLGASRPTLLYVP